MPVDDAFNVFFKTTYTTVKKRSISALSQGDSEPAIAVILCRPIGYSSWAKDCDGW